MNKTLRKSLFFILKICVTLLVISPFYIAIIYSVKSKPEMVTNRLAFPKTIHWDNFTRAIETSNFGLAMKNSLITTVVAVFVITLICTMAAYIIARKNNRFYNTIYYIFVGAMIIPFQSIMTPLYIDMAKWKLLNTLHGFIMAKIGFRDRLYRAFGFRFCKVSQKIGRKRLLLTGVARFIRCFSASYSTYEADPSHLWF